MTLTSQHPNALPREEIVVIAQFWYECPADMPASRQSDAIHRDLVRLIGAPTDAPARCTAATITGFAGDKAHKRDRADKTPRIQADRIGEALAYCYADDSQVTAHLVTNALADLRHLCDASGLDFAALDRNGYQTYIAERAEARLPVK